MTHAIEIEPIGHVRAKRDVAEDDFWGGAESCITLVESFEPDALAGLEDFSHAEILFVFDRVTPGEIVRGARHPRGNPAWPRVGIFAQRAKGRPNRLGSTVCRILRCEGRSLFVAELDAIDGTPVIDIKPVLRELLPREDVRQPAWSVELMREYWEREE